MSLPINFNGTPGDALNTYDSGFTRLSGDTGTTVITAGGRARRGNTSGAQYTWGTDLPPSADYWVEAKFTIESNNVLERIGICGRASNSARTFYYARIRTTGSNPDCFVELYKAVSGTFTQLGSGYTISNNGDPTYTIRLDMQGSTIRVLVDSVERISVTDSAITAAGRIGTYQSADATSPSDTAGTQIDDLTASFAASDVTATGAPPTITLTAPTGVATSGAPVTASGSPPTITLTAPTGAASEGSTLELQEFFGSNVSIADSIVTNPDTATPTVDIVIRNPEGGTAIWQHFRFALVNVAGKTVTVNIDLTDQEGGNTIRSTWSGPYKANTLDDLSAWTPIARSAPAGVLTFDVVGGSDNTLYICSMPPGIRPQAEAWIDDLIATYPGMIHDDLPSRVAAGIGPYACDTAPTVVDELGRTISGEPMMGFRIGNDAVGTPSVKPEICVFSMIHPGEDHGFIQLRGFVNKWLSDAAFATVRGRYNVIVRPIGAPNGGKGGYRRYEPRVGLASGDNLNREWKASSLNGTAQKWLDILDADHGETFPRVRALIDFHDLAHSSQIVTAYYRAETPNGTELRAIIAAEFTGEQILESVSDDTTTDYFVNTKGVGPAFTAEVSDQSTGLSGFIDVGAGWANIVKAWHEAGWLGADAQGAPPQITLTPPSGQADDGIEAIGETGFIAGNVVSAVQSVVVESTKFWRG